MRRPALCFVLGSMLLGGCSYRSDPRGPVYHLIPDVGAMTHLYRLRDYAADVSLTEMRVELEPYPRVYLQGVSQTPEQILLLIESLRAEPQYRGIRSDWDDFSGDSSKINYSVTGVVGADDSPRGSDELIRAGAPELPDILRAIRSIDPEEIVSRHLTFRLQRRLAREDDWEVSVYDVNFAPTQSARPALRAFLSIMAALERRYPTLRGTEVRVWISKGRVARSLMRIKTYLPVPLEEEETNEGK